MNDPFIYEGSSDSDSVPNSDDSEEFEKQETGRRRDMEENITHRDGAREMQKDDSKDDIVVERGMTESRSDEIVVMTTNNGIARKWDKKHYCCYCLQPQSKLPRHLQTCRPDESDMCGFIQKKDKAGRQKLLCKLRNLGNHLHNCEVKRENRGTLIVGYRPVDT